ncbi:hypothetical protein AP460_02737 [Actinobacillus pleuropneumoniae]|nr:hypothetical protein AP518_02845 [Actinobacillus pleuropneumoniae]KIE92071.1 hypothetical protein AP460_02737 [Actinobacillus pleuropneumoniae]KIE97202.1 hypothetical protein AP5651_02853 [Actinobacillus pleuropneumoniae]KIE98175.1 hypothetical protein AP780_02803 [Actinobacillus pleuropneumoniae]KIE99105.1 Type 4 prepilin subunit ApfA [Actinobacillus pleuropneumoniae]
MQKLSLIRPLTNAFTLIELMIVIAIIAILATVAIPSYNSYTKKRRFRSYWRHRLLIKRMSRSAYITPEILKTVAAVKTVSEK